MKNSFQVSDLIEKFDEITKKLDNDGIVIVRNVLDQEKIDQISQWWDSIRRPLRNGECIQGLKRYNHFYIHGVLPWPVGDIYKHNSIVSFMTNYLGQNLALYMNRLNIKDFSFDSPIHLHQDIPYFHGTDKKLTSFLALTDVNFNNGGMFFVKGSHKLGHLGKETLDINKFSEQDVFIPTLRAGDMLISDIHTIHASLTNIKKTDRLLLQVIYQPASDGAYYQDSIKEPTLVNGEWETELFEPWTHQ
ncbi:hypothetical protein C2869_15710 [Saccharobesus litoralis]|uniref:Phytanoyl-CoA dioxygenase n=1 Tax=Saccharobesus litoralis TaxID=2172099 RepID=A0A2S0VU88_9ALTE|nr:phytanoyl-CoA dioxygenase family protein [Saccharobesus litoralis]AWB67781.1 hypothetical protein C2869_15710 [Saccharobesus litoralis]